MNEYVYIPVSLRLIKWNKETVENGSIVQTPKQCYAFTTSSGRAMNINGVSMNTTTTCSINGVDINSKSTGLSYAKWLWDCTEDMYQALVDEGLSKCFIKVSYNDTLADIVEEEIVSTEEYNQVQVADRFTVDNYLTLQSQAV